MFKKLINLKISVQKLTNLGATGLYELVVFISVHPKYMQMHTLWWTICQCVFFEIFMNLINRLIAKMLLGVEQCTKYIDFTSL